jgi:hypothetical protein
MRGAPPGCSRSQPQLQGVGQSPDWFVGARHKKNREISASIAIGSKAAIALVGFCSNTRKGEGQRASPSGAARQRVNEKIASANIRAGNIHRVLLQVSVHLRASQVSAGCLRCVWAVMAVARREVPIPNVWGHGDLRCAG